MGPTWTLLGRYLPHRGSRFVAVGLFAAIAGVLVMALFGSVRLIKQGHRVRRLEKERETIKRTLS